ncbi:hypothetical protein B0T10DRAFT_562605 [Thelonectria olida]|uniref:Uncharacterized protein n=1 Tax=Thelonectria olida TaxID=1576542 RepID=A0A9P8W5G9_9HYPO|nr:hypothetical protein B0T10DRAFT_562605 [Thelonectria olida]
MSEPNCTSLQSLHGFDDYLKQLRIETDFTKSNLTYCKQYICVAIWGGGNPDISGIGISIGYVVQIALAVGLAAAVMIGQDKQGHKWTCLQSVTKAGFEAFFSFAIYFALSANIASIVVLVDKDFGVSTAGFGASEAEIALAMSVACILPLVYPIGLLPVRIESRESRAERKIEEERQNHGLRLLLFSLLGVVFLYPFVSQALHNWAPLRIGEGKGPGGSTLVTDEEFSRVEEMCFGTIGRFTSWESRLLAGAEMAASILIYLCIIWHLVIAHVRRMERDDVEMDDHRRITAAMSQARAYMEMPWKRSKLMRGLFLFIPAALNGILLYCIFRLRDIQERMLRGIEREYAGNEWGFGQIVSIIMFAPVVVEMAFTGWTVTC